MRRPWGAPMRKLRCPKCDEVVKVPDTGGRCPSCGARIRVADPDDDLDEDEPRQAPRKKKKRRESIRGLIPLILFGSLGLAVAVAAPFFSAVGTWTVVWYGCGLGVVSLIFVRRMYEYVGENSPGIDEAVTFLSMFYAIRDSFRKPRQFAAWTFLLWFGIALFVEGLVLVVAFKTLQENPVNVPNAGGGQLQQPGGGPNAGPGPQPAGPQPKPDPDAAVDKEINDALAKLHDPDSRVNAAAFLGRMKPKPNRSAEVAKKLAGLVNEPKADIRQEAIKALGVWGDKEYVPVFIQAAGDEDGLIRCAAVKALRPFRDERAIPVLVRLLFDPIPCRDEVASALIEVGPPAEKAVLALLSTTQGFDQGKVIDILKEIGTAESLPPLRKIAASDLFAAGKAKEAIQAINARAKKKSK
jgi:hypothetical protein